MPIKDFLHRILMFFVVGFFDFRLRGEVDEQERIRV